MRAGAIVTVNLGSSSLRLDAFDEGGRRRASVRFDLPRPDEALIASRLRAFALPLGRPAAVAHRVVHGGPRLAAPALVDAAVEAEIASLVSLAPLHQPAALAGLRAARAVFGDDVPQVAAFDTSFFHDLPEAAATYALPRELIARHQLRRYGFHGLAHQSMARRLDAPRAITLQLGAGCSATALASGRPVDTTMGFSPLEGLVMATRPGDVDPGLLLHLLRGGETVASLDEALEHRSGLRGLGGFADVRALLAAESSGDADARLALDVYCHRARRYLGALLAVLGGVDAIAFGGGTGEHAPAIRARILSGLAGLGLLLDEPRNAAATSGDAIVSPPGAAVAIHVLSVDEATELRDAARAALG